MNRLRIKAVISAGIFVGLCAVGTVSAVFAQQAQRPPERPPRPDSSNTAVRADTILFVGLGYTIPHRVGTRIKGDIATAPFPELSQSLANATGAMFYDLSAHGWAHGISLFGSDPNTTGLHFGWLSLDDLFFGRPRFDFAPVTSIESTQFALATSGRLQGFDLSPRDYDNPKPLTEGLYWSGSDALQSVSITHSQRRRFDFGGSPGLLGFVAGYHGDASTGEYPSSKLTRGRQMLARIRYQQQSWSLELLELYNRGSVAQHAGVNAPIYRRLEASVSNAGAVRQTRRNDLSATLRAKSIGSLPFDANLSYSRQSDVFIDGNASDDTLRTKVHRAGVVVQQPLALAGMTITPFGSAFVDEVRRSSWLPDSLSESVTATSVGLRVGAEGLLDLDGEIALHRSGRESGIGVVVSGSKSIGVLTFVATGGSSLSQQSLYERNGYAGRIGMEGDFDFSGTDRYAGRLTSGRIAASISAGLLDVEIGSFLNTTSSGSTVLVAVTADSLTFAPIPSTTTMGFTGTAAWRERTSRGIYANVKTTVSPWHASTSSVVTREFQSRPELWVRGSIGARYTLFKGDLIANAYVRGTYWSSFTSRVFHAASGLYALPAEPAAVVPSSHKVDVVLEAIVRTATLFFSYENALAGTQMLEGNLLVDGYPLADQRFRLGVFWPIFD